MHRGLIDGYDIAQRFAEVGSHDFILPATLLNSGFPIVWLALNGAAKTHNENGQACELWLVGCDVGGHLPETSYSEGREPRSDRV